MASSQRRTPAVRFLLTLLIFMLLTPLLTSAESDSSSDEAAVASNVEAIDIPLGVLDADGDFEPQQEWTEVPRGASIPGGLHVRMDIEQGKTFAKLMEPSDSAETVKSVVVVPEGETRQTVTVTPAEQTEDEEEAETSEEGIAVDTMRDVLMSLPEPEPELTDAVKRNISPEEFEELLKKVWARRQEELREAIANVKSDADFMKSLLSSLLDDSSEDAVKAAVLEDLEYHCGKIDNARDFHTIGGLAAVVPLLNSTSPTVLANAAWLIGTVVKLDRPLQESALELGALPLLLKALRTQHNLITNGGVALKPHSTALRRLVYSLSSLLRSSPLSKSNLLLYPDTPALLSDILSRDPSRITRTVAKVVVLLGELAHEELTLASTRAEGADPVTDTAHDGPNIYAPIIPSDLYSDDDTNNTSLAPLLSSSNICSSLLTALPVMSNSGDGVEKAISTLYRMRPFCIDSQPQTAFSTALAALSESVEEFKQEIIDVDHVGLLLARLRS